MTGSLTVRPLNEEDWEIFSKIRLDGLKECPSVFGARLEDEEKYKPEEWQAWLRRKNGRVFGLFNTNQIIGITGVVTDRENQDTGRLIASYIKPTYRGKGLSNLLYQARLDWAKAYPSWKKLWVGHRDGNEPSRRANQRHGFVFMHRLPKTWPDGTSGDELCYELDLEKLRQGL